MHKPKMFCKEIKSYILSPKCEINLPSNLQKPDDMNFVYARRKFFESL